MNISKVIELLRENNEPVPTPAKLPSEQQVAAAERDLDFKFGPQYRTFLLEASDVVYGVKEPARISDNRESCMSLHHVAQNGWSMGVPKEYLPFCYDNGNFFTVDSDDVLGFYDHDSDTHDVLQGYFVDWIIEDWLEIEE